MFAKMMTGFFWDSYDNLGKLLLANLLWFLCNMPGFLVVYGVMYIPFNIFWILLFVPFILFSVTTIGLYYFTSLLVEQKDIGLKELFTGMKKFGARGLFYSTFFIGCMIILAVNIHFYLNLSPGIRWIGAVLAGFAFWVSLFVSLVCQYLFPLLVRQNLPIKKLLLRSTLLVLDNFWVSIAIILTSLGLFILTALTGVGPILFTMSLVTLWANNALYELLAKYDETPQPTLKPGEKPTSWHQILPKEKPKWRHEDRGWKDILRPWDT